MTKRARRALWLANAIALAWWSTAAAAAAPLLSVGDVVVSSEARDSGGPAPELGRALRQAIKDELSRSTSVATLKQPLIMSATLTRLSSERRDDRTRASASISLALRRAHDDVLLAELRGRASVEDASDNPASLQRAALQGAVRGALQRLPEVVARTR